MTQRKFRTFESAKVLLGKIGGAEVWWIRWDSQGDLGMLRTRGREFDVMFLCGGENGPDHFVPEMDEDNMPFKMTLSAAQSIYNVLEKTDARYLNKRVWSEYIAFRGGEPRVASSTFSGDVGELLLDEIKALRVEMHKEKESEK